MEQQKNDAGTLTKQLLLITGVLAFLACSLLLPIWLWLASLFLCLLISTTKTLGRIYGKRFGHPQTHASSSHTVRKILIPAIQIVLSIPIALFLLILALILIFILRASLNVLFYCAIPVLILWIVSCCFSSTGNENENIPLPDKEKSKAAPESDNSLIASGIINTAPDEDALPPNDKLESP